ncbi:MAG: FAD-binding oxidoreductase [Candidatus Thorarchaeota archaeon]|nr:FAD-binding oxidoreductase [Candidatus Thorarchaeota archaeon]
MTEDMVSIMTGIVGRDDVSDNDDVLSKYSGKTIPSLVVWPKTTDEIARIVRWANLKKISLLVRSSSGPRLRGDWFPKVENTIILDLSKMDRILRIDPLNKVVMIEPGVTYGKLLKELTRKGLRPAIPFIPEASKSVLSACLDREPTIMPRFHWDSSDPLLCTETVFGTGDVLRTGAAAGPGSLEEQWASGQAQKNPQGPSQFDPFRLVQGAQGTIGIVTWISMKCEQLPEHHKLYLAGSDNLNDFMDFNYAVLRRRLADEHFMLNKVNFEAAIASANDIPEWVLVIGVSGHGMIAEEELEYRTGDIMDIARETNIILHDSLGKIKGTDILTLLNKPSDVAYWKLQVYGECHEIFFLTTLDRAKEFYEVFQNTANTVGFPIDQIGAYIQPLAQGTNTHVGLDLFYSPEDKELVEKMISLSSMGQAQLLNRGAYFSRPYGFIVDAVFKHASSSTLSAMRRVKQIFDPSNILNPGALCFKEVLQ